MLIIPFPLLTASGIILTKENSVASSGTTVFVSPSNITVNVNRTFEVAINVSGVTDLYGWEFKLSWHTSLLEAVNITENSFLRSGGDTYFVPKIIDTDGYIMVGCTLLTNRGGVTGNGTLATVEFRAEKVGSGTLELYDTKLVTSIKQLTSHSNIDGTVQIFLRAGGLACTHKGVCPCYD